MKDDLCRLVAYCLVFAFLGIFSGIYFGFAYLAFKWVSQ